jgi:hypothetical protein
MMWLPFVRRAESQLDEEKKEQLKETMWLWRKNPENLSEKEEGRLKRIDQTDLWTAKAYQMRLALQDIYRLPYRSLSAAATGLVESVGAACGQKSTGSSARCDGESS